MLHFCSNLIGTLGMVVQKVITVLNEPEQIVAALTLTLALPVIVLALRMWRERGAVSVTAKIAEIEEVQEEEGVYYYPTFEVVGGPFGGRTYRSEWDCGPSSYQVGEHVRASIFPETGEIYGDRRSVSNWFVWFSPFVAVLLFVISNKLF